MAGRCGGNDRQAISLAFEHWQTVQMGADPSHKQRVTIKKQMLRRDRSSNIGRSFADEFGGLNSGYMLERKLQAGEVVHDLLQLTADKHALTVKNIDIGVRDLAMNQKGKGVSLHRRQSRIGSLK